MQIIYKYLTQDIIIHSSESGVSVSIGNAKKTKYLPEKDG